MNDKLKTKEALIAELQSLQERERQYRLITETTSDAIITIDEASTILYANPSAEKMFGYSIGELVGKPLTMLMPESLRRKHAVSLKEYIQTGKKHLAWNAVEFPGLHKDGSEIALEISYAEFMQGKKRVFMGILRDITARKHTEQAVRESENKYRTLMEHASDGIFIADPSGKYIEVNSKGCEMLGYTREEILQRSIRDLLSADELSRNPLRLDELRAGKTLLSERRMLRKNGSVFPVEISAKMLADGRLQGIVRDITERKRTAEALAQLEKRNTLILDSAGEGIYGVDLEGKATFMNPAAAKMLGWDAAELLGKHIHGIIHHTKPDGTPYPVEECMVFASFRDGKIHSSSNELFWRKDGTSFPVEFMSTPIRDEHGTVLGAVATFKDITERKEAERRSAVTSELFKLFTDVSTRKEYLDRVVEKIRDCSGCQNVGVRILDSEGNIPYEAYVGFTKKFLNEENWLCIERDQCACIRIINGLIEPQDLPCITPNGSFYTNNSSGFLSKLTEEEKTRFRGTCVATGYESIAIVPLRYGEKILGAIHLTDENKGKLPLHVVQFLESLALIIAEIAHKFSIEDRLRESEERLRTLIESSEDIVVVQDLEGRYSYISVSPQYGVQANDVLGKTPYDVHDRLFADSIMQRLRQVVASEKGVMRESEMEWKGKKYWFSDYTYPITNANGNVSAIATVSRNITDLKRTEEVLKESEERFRTMADTAPVMIWLSGPDKSCTYLNKPWLDFRGRTLEQELGKGWMEGVHADDLSACLDTYDTAANLREPYRMEYLLRRYDGEYRWMLENGVPRFTADGEFLGYLGSCIDITERKRAEQTIQRQLSFAQALNRISEAIIKQENPVVIIQSTTDIVGETLGVDRCLIYDIALEANQAIALSEWLNPNVRDITPTKATYNLDLFKGGNEEVLRTRRHLVSYKDKINENFIKDGSGKLLHEEMQIQSLLWYPFDFRPKNYGVLVFNQVAAPREWQPDEIEFVGAVAHQVTLALQKIRLLDEGTRAQELLVFSEQSYKGLFNSVGDAIYVQDAEGKFLDVNDGAVEMYGYPREYFIGKTPAFLSAPGRNDLAATQEAIQRAFAGEPQRLEWWGIRKNGEVFPKDVRLTKGSYFGKDVIIAIARDITERKQAEDAVRESEERFRALSEASFEALFISEKGICLGQNHTAEKMFGYTLAEALGRSGTDWIIPDDRALVLKNMLSGYEKPYEVTAQRKNGATFPCEIQGRMFTYKGRNVRITALRDISRQKQAQEALQQSEIKYRTIFENVQEVFYQADNSGCIIDISPSIQRYSGYAREDVIGRSIEEFYTNPEDRKHFLLSLYKKGEVVDHVFGLKTKSNRVIYVSANSHLVYDAEGKTRGVEGTLRDVTERENAIRALRQAEEKYRSIFENAVEGIFQTTPEGQFISANPALAHMYGYASPEELITSNIDLEHQYYVKAGRRSEFKHIIETEGIVKRFESQVYTKDRQIIWISEDARAVRDENGRTLFYEGFIENITERKALETQFLRAQRMESLGTLAGGIAHDLNNVLAPILMAVELLQRESTTEKQKGMLDIIKASSTRGADIVKQVLTFSRGIGSERAILQPKLVLREIESFTKETFPRNLEIRSKIPKDIWSIMADATQIHQVLLNLCVNARDAMPNGGVLTITVENTMIDQNEAKMHPDAKAGRYLQFRVADTGMGIPPDIMEKIFDPFFTTKDIGKGTGLGLSTLAGIVKNHEGFVKVYSEVGKGTEFRIYIPAVETTANKKSKRQFTAAPAGNGELILVVDDEASVREITKATLESNGYRVIAAGDGVEAISMYAQNKDEIKVVLTDMMMPLMDGATTIRALEKIDQRVSVIATSGLVTDKTEAESLGPIVKKFLQKPYTSEKLLETLHEVLHA